MGTAEALTAWSPLHETLIMAVVESIKGTASGSIPTRVVSEMREAKAVTLKQGRTARRQIRTLTDAIHANILGRFTFI